jgi:ubiquinone/menaquinone biosynthesis C-methylase UbiE
MDTNTPRKLNEIEHGKKIAHNAEDVWGHAKLAGQSRIDRRVGIMIEKGGIDGSARVLELGCGTGEFTRRLADTGAEITGIDISPDLLALAEKKLSGIRNVRLEIADMEKLENFPENYFTAIVGNSVLHHVDYVACLRVALKKLASGGRIVFSEPNMMNPQIAIQKSVPFVKKMAGDSPDETAFFRKRLAEDLQKIGYKNVSVENFDFMHPAMPDALIGLFRKAFLWLEKVPIIKEISGSLLIYAEKE